MSTPATPVAPQAPTATPGNGPANEQQPPATPPAQQQPAQPANVVQLTAEEHKQLLRDQARLRSLQRRGTPPAPAMPAQGADQNDEVAQVINENSTLKQQLLQRDVREGVRDLLAKPEYASLPESTRKLILKNPASLSEAKDLNGILADVEDYLDEESAALNANGGGQRQAPAAPAAPHQPQGHETPPKVGAGSPATPAADQFEDVTHLTGPARSQAAFRNAQRKARGLKQ